MSVSSFAMNRQKACEEFIKNRTKTEAEYADMINKCSKTTYAPLREYVSTLPASLRDIIPSYYVPLDEVLEFPEKEAQEREAYNAIVDKVMAFQEEAIALAQAENEKFAQEVHM